MAKIKKKKLKGVRYISKVLVKYFPKKYKNQRAASSTAKALFQELKDQGRKVRVTDILYISRKRRIKPEVKKSTAPEQVPPLFYKFYLDTYYFDLQDYPSFINSTSKEITFTSNLFNEGVTEVKGGSRPNYQKTFSGFVDFVNKNLKSRDEAYEYLVKGTPPEWNEEKQRWESRIISIDATGLETDFGYEPTPPKPITKEEVEKIDQKIKEEAKKEEKPKEKPEKITKSNRERELELELEVEKQKSENLRKENMKSLMELFKSGAISKVEFKELMQNL
jgi:hypothetical protein